MVETKYPKLRKIVTDLQFKQIFLKEQIDTHILSIIVIKILQ